MPRPFSTAAAERAFQEALPAVQTAFREQGIDPAGVVINVVFSEDDVLWALASAPPTLGDEPRKMLANSLRASAGELDDDEDV
jgi:hypothetical protein